MNAGLPLPAAAQLLAYRAVAGLVRAALAIESHFVWRPERATLVAERLGRWRVGENVRNGPNVWLHAASLGEVLAAGPLLSAVHRRWPAFKLLVTCNTNTGRAAAQRLGVSEVHYLPVDTHAGLVSVLEAVRPALFLFVETEIWPSLLLELADRGVPAAMVNARVSGRSFPRYRWIRPLVSAALETLEAVCARDEASRQRLLALGAPAARTSVVGDMKLDSLDAEQTASVPNLLASIDDGRPILLAASTHAGEEEIVLAAFEQIRRAQPGALLVLAPRHPDRAVSVAAVVSARSLVPALWSQRLGCREWDVLVVDTAGELRGFMPAAVAAFVGGSLVDAGGHNLLEPAAFGLPIVAGAGLANVAEQATALAAAEALTVVSGADELADAWRAVLAAPQQARLQGDRARAVVRAGAGAVQRTLEILEPLLAARASSNAREEQHALGR